MLTNCLRSEFKEQIKFISIHPGKMKTEIAQVDADIEPEVIANRILKFFENRTFVEENGIVEFRERIN